MSLFSDLLGGLSTPPVGRCRRISSNEQPNWNDGNFDMTRLAPGEVFELPVIKGPGVINHIWMTSHAGGVNELNAISIRIYWDGREEPGVEAPLGDFFAVGHGRPAVVESVPVQVSPTGSLSCYWRMPFAESARIVITNDNPDRASGLYWQVDYVEMDALPADTGYFYARYRQEYPATMGSDYLIADIEGEGQFVGTVMSVTLAQDGWFGEGDDFFFIDGEEIPSLQGTGSEDYFNDAWGFRPRVSAWFGQPAWQGWMAGDAGVCYRWHILDPVGFKRSLRFTMEHKGNRTLSEEAWYIERPDFFSSVAFWYQTGLPKQFAVLPSWGERRVPWVDHNLVRSWRAAKAEGGAAPVVQTVGFFGGRPSVLWPNSTAGATLELAFQAPVTSRYAVRLIAFSGADYGRCDIAIDDKTALAAADFSTGEGEETDLLLGVHTLAEGPHTLRFTALPNADGTVRQIAVEMIRILALPPEVNREVKNENEAHFIRLGVGRATYAYRLAYGELPESIETLVEAGLMEARYLHDENGYPLQSHCDGERLYVSTTAPDGWTSEWQGLDARR